ncbi:MAG: ABC transporter permease [Anaerolineaceae bacterium]|nr:ABC transporter permease [Anaerolineaceae bacterium]
MAEFIKSFLKPSFKKIAADFLENKSRSLLVIMSITIGVFAVGMINSGYLLLTESMASSYSDNNPANITIRTDPFDEGFVKMIARQDQVAYVEGRRTVILEARNPGEKQWKKLYITAIQDIGDSQIELLSPVDQSFVLEDKTIAILEDGNEKILAQPGRPLEIKLENGTTNPLLVAGIVKDYTAGRDIILENKRGYITSDTLPYLHESRYFDTLVIRVNGDSYNHEHIHAVAAAISDKVEQSGRNIYSSEIRGDADQPFSNYVQALGQIMIFIGLLIVILSSSLIINTMNALMAQHIRQIGIMKLIGAKRKKIILMYLTLVIGFGIISFLIAVPAGSFGGYLMCKRLVPSLNGQMQNVQHIPLFPSVIALQAIVAILIPMGASLFPILRGSKISIKQAFNNQKITNTGKTGVFNKILNRINFTDLIKKLSLENTFRNKARLGLTLFTLSLGGAMFIAVFNVQMVLFNQVDRIIAYDSADIVLQTKRPCRIEEIKHLTAGINDIDIVEGWWTEQAQLEIGKQIIGVTINAPPTDSPMVNKEVDVGRWMLPGETQTLVVNEAFYNVYPGLKPGDQIPLKIDGKLDEWTIVGIYNYTGFDEKQAFTNPASLIQRNHQPFHASSFHIITSQHDIDFQKEKLNEIQALFDKHGLRIAGIFSMKELLEKSTDKLNLVIVLLLTMAVLTGSVGSIGLSGTLSLNILERTGEIGILRAIGAGDHTITKLVLQEGFIIGIVSYLLGVIFSIPITSLLGTVVSNAIFSAPARLVITPKGYFYWFLVMALLCVIASLVPAYNAARMTIRDVLAYE